MKIKSYQVIISTLFVGTILFGRPLHTGLAVDSYNDHLPAGSQPVFIDVPYSYWAWEWIETLYRNGVTNGCSTNPSMYCPEDSVTRAQMAVFLERGLHGADYQPPAVGSSTGFYDVAVGHWAAAWIKQLAADGITLGCGNTNYCPEDLVTRAQMAIFLPRAKYGATYTPPDVGSSTGFNDVSSDYWAAAWIKQLATEGITNGCGNGNYCPEDPVTRAQMAVFLVRTFNLPSSIHPVGQVILHQADSNIIWEWYTYVSPHLDKTKPIIIFLGVFPGTTFDYEIQRDDSLSLLNWAIQWPEMDNFVLLTPIIPRTEDHYPVVFEYRSFQTPDDMGKRADLKVIKMINEFTRLLKQDGYQVYPKVMIEGFSAGGSFAQRFALLHPDLVQAIAVGGLGGVFTLPEESYQSKPIDWPVGINDLEEIADVKFDREKYMKINQYIFYGDQDTGKNGNTMVWPLDWGTGGFWKSVDQIEFITQYFGDKDFIRVQNQTGYLNSIGYSNITFHLYPGIGHEMPEYVIDDFMRFFLHEGFPSDIPTPTPAPTPSPTPTSSLPVLIDGYGNDWTIFTPVEDLLGDSADPDTDITAYYSTQDDNFFDIMLQTDAPIRKEEATVELVLSLETSDGNNQEYGFNFLPDGSAWGYYDADHVSRTPSVLVAWNEVVEIQIPKSLFNGSIIKRIIFIHLWININGVGTMVDGIP